MSAERVQVRRIGCYMFSNNVSMGIVTVIWSVNNSNVHSICVGTLDR
jgi:hypothetical protein